MDLCVAMETPDEEFTYSLFTPALVRGHEPGRNKFPDKLQTDAAGAVHGEAED